MQPITISQSSKNKESGVFKNISRIYSRSYEILDDAKQGGMGVRPVPDGSLHKEHEPSALDQVYFLQ